MQPSVLITGGAGFIGSNLASFLLQKDYEVTVYDNLSTGRLDYLDDLNCRIISGDILDSIELTKAMRGHRIVIHLAAYGSVVESIVDPVTNFDVNARGTLTTLMAARNTAIEHVIFASTGGALIGEAEPPVSERSLARPISPYDASKLVGEAYLSAFARSYGLHTTALRFANVFGPLSVHKKGALTNFIKAIMAEQPITIYGDGSASRDFLYVRDLCRGIELACRKKSDGFCVFHLASGIETTIESLVEAICGVSGHPDHPIKYLPSRTGEVSRNFATFDLAREQLGFSPSVSLSTGLELTWQWFLDQNS